MLYLGNIPIAGLTKPLVARNVGEIVTSSLPLTDAGLHLLDGSLLQGSGIYSGFVNYIADLYSVQETEWTQPILTSNGILGGDTFAVYASNNYDATTYPLYLSFDGNSSTIWYNSTAPVDVVIYNPNPLKITNIQCQNRIDADNFAFTAGTVYGSNDNVNYTQIGTFTNNVTTAGGTYNIDLSSNTNFYYYYKITFTSATTTGTGANFTITATQQSAPNYFCNESQWQQMVSTYGSCGKFVYDSVSKTVRLPKVSDILQGTTDINALGNLIEAGLPNITSSFGIRAGVDSPDTLMHTNYSRGVNTNSCVTNSDSVQSVVLSTSASLSSPIYGNSSTVQPQTVKVLYYIVIANSTKTDTEVDIDQVTTDLNGKADADLTNVTNTGYIKMAGASMPSDRYINLTLGASGSTYTAPANGWFQLAWLGAGASCQFYNDSAGSFWETKYGETQACSIQAKKGDTIIQYYTMGSASMRWFRFYYAQGSESEAN